MKRTSPLVSLDYLTNITGKNFLTKKSGVLWIDSNGILPKGLPVLWKQGILGKEDWDMRWLVNFSILFCCYFWLHGTFIG
jgi:hypothetical protein